MTTQECNCDESKTWKARYLESEAKRRQLGLSVRFAQRNLERLLEKLDVVLNGIPAEDVTTLENGVCGQTTEEAAWAQVEKRIHELANGAELRPDEQLTPASWRELWRRMAEKLRADESKVAR